MSPHAQDEQGVNWGSGDGAVANSGTPLGNLGAVELLLSEHARGEHWRVPHPDCGGCRAARQMARGEMPWEGQGQ